MVSSLRALQNALAAPVVEPKALVALADEVLGAVARGDCMIGILPVDAIGDIIQALRVAVGAGLGREEGRARLMQVVATLADQELGSSSYMAEAAAALGELGDREGTLAAARIWMELDAHDNAEKALELVRAECEADADGRAHLLLGYMTYRGYGTGPDADESARLHEVAAEHGNADAMFELYVLFSTGQGVAKDEVRALGWCERAAALEHGRALYNLGAFHATGRGVVKNVARSLEYYLRASAAGNGRASATAGTMLWEGEGAAIDRDRARALFELAAEQGCDVDGLLDAVGISLETS